MEVLSDILNSQLFIAIISSVISSVITLLTKNFLKKKLNWNKGIVAFLFSSIFIIVFIAYREFISPRVYMRSNIEKKVNAIIYDNKWLTYDPSDFNPITGQIPSPASIEKDLVLIKKNGFDGIITFNCNPYMKIVPELAKKHSLKTIIGIWNPNNRAELINAASLKKNCEGYCVGHNGLNKKNMYTRSQLKRAIRLLRSYTQKPVTTTELIKDYSNDIIEVVDWIFPDAHIYPENDSLNIDRDVTAMINFANKLDSMNIHNKPILLKMIIYPYRGIANASPENQKKFYNAILQSKRNPFSGLSKNIVISANSLNDEPWKTEHPFHKWEAYTGFIENDTIGRPALASIRDLMEY